MEIIVAIVARRRHFAALTALLPLLLLGFCLSCRARAAQPPTIATEADLRVATTTGYSATVAGDGCLTNLKPADGDEMLETGIDVSRGIYFYQGNRLNLNTVTQPQPDTIEARSGAASIRYTFAPNKITCTASNTSGGQQQLFVVINPDIDAVGDGVAAPEKPGVVHDWNRLIAYRGGVKVTVDGCDKVWGPWPGPDGKCQVVETDLAAGQTRTFTLSIAFLTAEDRKALGRLLPVDPLHPDPLTLDAPLDYEVFQRETRKAGHIRIAGRYVDPNATVEARIGDKDTWHLLATDPATRSFFAELSAPAGGWYTVAVRTVKGKAPAETVTVAHVGVGEVFLGAGQSNSTNYGEIQSKPTSGMVSTFSGADWRIADDPQPGTHDKSTGGSFWPAFGDDMYARFHVPIGIATTGHGGTSVNRWQPGGDLYTWTMTRVLQFGPHGFRALLWHQGEDDVEMNPTEYARKLGTVIQASRAEAGWDIPWFVAQVSYHDPAHPSFPNTREAQKMLWDLGVALPGPDTDTLTGDMRDHGGAGIHLSPKGLKAHGDLWAKVVGDWVERQ